MDELIDIKKGLFKQRLFMIALVPFVFGVVFGIYHAICLGVFLQFDGGKTGWQYFYDEFKIYLLMAALSIPLVGMLSRALSTKQSAHTISYLLEKEIKDSVRNDFFDGVDLFKVELSNGSVRVAERLVQPLKCFNYFLLGVSQGHVDNEFLRDSGVLLDKIEDHCKSFGNQERGLEELKGKAVSYIYMVEALAVITTKSGSGLIKCESQHGKEDELFHYYVIKKLDGGMVKSMKSSRHDVAEKLLTAAVAFNYSSEVIAAYNEAVGRFLKHMSYVLYRLHFCFGKECNVVGSEDIEDVVPEWKEMDSVSRECVLFWKALPSPLDKGVHLDERISLPILIRVAKNSLNALS